MALYVARYHPTNPHDPDHWAIYIDDPVAGESIHQVIGTFGIKDSVYEVAPSRSHTRPEDAPLFKEKVFVGMLSPSAAVSRVRDLIQAYPVDDKNGKRNYCQTWVMEVVNELGERGLLKFDWDIIGYLHGQM
ncbi:MAG: hypothetical protein Q9166_000961 [cf. Caloplaca sp. 2 TL-2023]